MSTKGIEMPNELELYPHNEKAYRKLLDMLSETRRACIIHPTGTGKAFIAYRYALTTCCREARLLSANSSFCVAYVEPPLRSLELSEKEACLTECGILEATRATFEPH